MKRKEIVNDSDTPLTISGVPGRLTHRTRRESQAPGLWFKQRWVSTPRSVPGWGHGALMKVELRFDDELGNGHNDFAITAEIYRPGSRDCEACGCLHDEVAKFFPELAPLVRWHLVGTDGPMHYLANAVYMAGDRDHNGRRKGEAKPLRNPKGENWWKLVVVNEEGVLISKTPTGDGYRAKATLPLFIIETSVKGEAPPAHAPRLEWRQEMIEGEGKARELDSARSIAVWPDATDEELSAEPESLRKTLIARLPKLLADFRKDLEATGFLWSSEKL